MEQNWDGRESRGVISAAQTRAQQQRSWMRACSRRTAPAITMRTASLSPSTHRANEQALVGSAPVPTPRLASRIRRVLLLAIAFALAAIIGYLGLELLAERRIRGNTVEGIRLSDRNQISALAQTERCSPVRQGRAFPCRTHPERHVVTVRSIRIATATGIPESALIRRIQSWWLSRNDA